MLAHRCSAAPRSHRQIASSAPALEHFGCRRGRPRLLRPQHAHSGAMRGSLQEVRPGRQLYVHHVYGDPQAELADTKLAIIFAHGANGDNSLFEEQVKLLASAGAQCTVYDMLGCGRSSKPRPASPEGRTAAYSAHEHYADLEAVLDTLVAIKGHQKVVLIGYSLGAALSIRLAAERPEHVQGVVLLGVGYSRRWATQDRSGSHNGSKGRPEPAPLGSNMGPAKALLQTDSNWLDQGLRQVFKVMPRQPWWREMPEWLLTLLMPFVALQTLPYFFSPRTFRRHPGFVFTEWLARARNKPWVVQATGKQISQITEPWQRFTGWLEAIQAPTLIIDQESCYPGPELMAADMQDGIGYSIPEAEHQVHQDQPAAVNSLILDFLQQKVCRAEGSTADKRKQH